MTLVVPAEVPTAKVLQGLFDPTPAEARVARGIGEGRTVEAIAGRFRHLPRDRAQIQLKVVLAKTGLGRQVELAGLLAGIKMPPGSTAGKARAASRYGLKPAQARLEEARNAADGIGGHWIIVGKVETVRLALYLYDLPPPR